MKGNAESIVEQLVPASGQRAIGALVTAALLIGTLAAFLGNG